MYDWVLLVIFLLGHTFYQELLLVIRTDIFLKIFPLHLDNEYGLWMMGLPVILVWLPLHF